MKTLLAALAFVVFTLPLRVPAQDTYKPPEGYVPDAETAIKIAVAVWEPIYGKETIAAEQPYRATLSNGIWTVRGSLPPTPHIQGGVAEADISKDDGRVLRVIHGKCICNWRLRWTRSGRSVARR